MSICVEQLAAVWLQFFQWPFSWSHLSMSICVEQLAAVWVQFFQWISHCIAWSHVNNLLFQWSSRDCSQPFTYEQVTGHALQVWSLPFGCLVRFNCARNSFEHWQPSMGLTWIPRAFEPYHESCMDRGCIFFLTSPPWVPFLMCFCVLLSSGRLGPARAEVGLGFALLYRLVQALPSSPSSAGLVACPSAFAFLFPCLFGVLPVSG